MRGFICTLFLFFNLFLNQVAAQQNYCWYSYRPNTALDSVLITKNNFTSSDIYQLVKVSKGKVDTVFIKKISLTLRDNTILSNSIIKKERAKKGKLIHIIEHKYTGNRYKLTHYYDSKSFIYKTTNQLKKGFNYENSMAFDKIKYTYNKEGLLIKANYYLKDYTLENKKSFLSILYSYK